MKANLQNKSVYGFLLLEFLWIIFDVELGEIEKDS